MPFPSSTLYPSTTTYPGSTPVSQQFQHIGASGGVAAKSFTLLAGANIGDTVIVVHGNNFYTAANLNSPTGTAVGGGWTLKNTLDGGTNDGHIKVWKGTITNASGTIVEGTGFADEERYFSYWVFPGYCDVDDFAGTDSDTSSASHVAPSVTPDAGSYDFLICVTGNISANRNYTGTPTGMTAAGTEVDTGFGTWQSWYETLNSDSATGTRTATSSGSDAWLAVSILIQVSAPPPPLDTLSFVGSTAWVTGTTSVAPTYPGSLQENDAVYAIVHHKPNTVDVSTPANWSLVGKADLGSGTQGAGTGTTEATIFRRIVPSGGLSGSQSFTITSGNTAQACMVAWRPSLGTGSTWETESFVTAASAAASANPTHGIAIAAGSLLAGDFVNWIVGTPDDTSTNISNTSIACTGATFAAAVRVPNTTSASGTGNDIAAAAFYSSVTAGPNTGTTLSIVSNITASETSGALAFVPRARTNAPSDTPKAGSDSTTLVEASSISVEGSRTDTAALVEAKALAITGSKTDVFAVSEISSLTVVYNRTDSIAFNEGASGIAISGSRSDIVSFVETSSGSSTIDRSDSATLAESSSAASTLSGTDSASLVEASSISGTISGSDSATLNDTSSLSADSTAAAALSASASLQIAVSATRIVTVALTTGASLAPVSGLTTDHGTVSLSVVPLLSVNVDRTALTSVLMSCAAELDAGVTANRFATTLLDTVASLTSDGLSDSPAAVTLNAIADLDSEAIERLLVSSILNVVAHLTVTGQKSTTITSAPLSAAALLDVSLDGSASASTTLVALASLLSEGVGENLGAASLVGVADLDAEGVQTVPLSALLSTSASLTSSQVATRIANILMSATGVLTANGIETVQASAVLNAIAQLSGSGDILSGSGTFLDAVADLDADGLDILNGAASLSASGLLIVESDLERLAAVNLITQSLLAAQGGKDLQAPLATLIATSSLIADVTFTILKLPIQVRGPILQLLFRSELESKQFIVKRGKQTPGHL